MNDPREFFENLVYQTVDMRRYTQQSPVMPDVWIEFGLHPGRQVELLMVPNWHYTPADLARELKARIAADEGGNRLATYRASSRQRMSPAIAHNQNVVVATLWFDQLIRAVLPLSRWWIESISGVRLPDDRDRLSDWLEQPSMLKEGLADALETLGSPTAREKRSKATPAGGVPTDVVWLARVAGLVAHLSSKAERDKAAKSRRTGDGQVRYLRKQIDRHSTLAKALVDILTDLPAVERDPHPLYSVNLNRKATSALYDSLGCIKADAAVRVFNVRGRGVRWAVIDTGIDARHMAFRRRDATGQPKAEPFERPSKAVGRSRKRTVAYANNSRVVATYDFVHVRELLSCDPDAVDQLDRTLFPALESPVQRAQLVRVLQDLELHNVDWERLEPFLRIPHAESGDATYRAPGHRHGTHVAGIIGADWRATDASPPADADLTGVCPEIELYDLRVLDETGAGNEFAIMSALQFVRDLNKRKDFVAVHGVNLSLSIPHDVANYACGRTPVCEEAERLVGSGVVVVAAAGNSGRARYLTPAGTTDEGFRTVSITDPGNADGVITVGATHRRDAHAYGVSYFSSRGPTGDGRQKPDIVAPGEKIVSTVPDNGQDRLDGTSMAAPHVSGAVALILTRHPELIGQPRKVKEILCGTATDLGRERYFQGSGLLDILRALQSI